MKQSSSCIVVKTFDNIPHILLVHAAGNWKIKQFGIPKGNVDPKEKLKAAAVRETSEETGIIPDVIKYVGYVDYRTGKKRVHAYLAKVKSGKID